MSASWPQVALGKVSTIIERPEAPLAGTLYRQIGVRLWGEGAYERETIDGSQTKYKTLSKVETDDIIVNKIWARNGSVAVVSESLAGCFGSGEFPTFAPDKTRLLPRWMHWITKTKEFREQCDKKSQGTSGKNRIKTEGFLEIPIPLPPLVEQLRIVAMIEDLAAKIEEAKELRQLAVEAAKALLSSEADRILKSLEKRYTVKSFGSFYPHVTSGPRNWGKHYEASGYRFYRAQDIGPHGEVLSASKVFISPPPGEQGRTALLQSGDLMLVITGATVGRCAVFRDGLEKGFVSQHVAICRLPQGTILPDFALMGMRAPQGQEQLLDKRYGQGKPGLNLSNIRALSLPIPPLPEQLRIVKYLGNLQDKTDALKHLQIETAAELNGMLPAILDRAFKGEL